LQTPKISVVMALYNTPYNYLKTTVESILNQTLNDFELIVIDDASSVEYREFFEQFNDERIKYFKLEQNGGPGKARNEGIKKASGEYIAIADSDDIYMPERFQVQADFLDKNLEISLISCSFKQSNNGKISSIVENNEDIKIEMLFNSQLANPAVMFRRNIFTEKNLFYPENINFAEDYQLWINAIFVGVKCANLKDVLMIYTRRSGQLSKEKSDKQAAILKNIYKNLFSKMPLNASQEELDLHYDIYCEKFKTIKNVQQISSWFDKIIEHNKELKVFDEEKLIKKKEQIIEHYNKVKNRLFKTKIGNYNLCMSKTLKFSLEVRD
jgi:glycosyltransferase involved in cell wall biosynthesis